MRKLISAAVLSALTAASAGAAAAPASAAPSAFAATCATGTTTFPLRPLAQPTPAATPLQVQGSSSVLVPFKIVLNGQVLLDRTAGPDQSTLAGQLTTCTFTSSPGTFTVTGLLTPPGT